MNSIAPEIFKAYDIRGIVGKSLTAATAEAIGRSLGSEARRQKIKSIVVGRDGRLSGPELVAALAKGIASTGTDVIDIGCVPTPVTYFAAHELGTQSCVSVTGSHNPPDYNGFKMVLDGQTLYGEMIQDLYRRAARRRLSQGARQDHAGRCAQSLSQAHRRRCQAGPADEDRRRLRQRRSGRTRAGTVPPHGLRSHRTVL